MSSSEENITKVEPKTKEQKIKEKNKKLFIAITSIVAFSILMSSFFDSNDNGSEVRQKRYDGRWISIEDPTLNSNTIYSKITSDIRKNRSSLEKDREEIRLLRQSIEDMMKRQKASNKKLATVLSELKKHMSELDNKVSVINNQLSTVESRSKRVNIPPKNNPSYSLPKFPTSSAPTRKSDLSKYNKMPLSPVEIPKKESVPLSNKSPVVKNRPACSTPDCTLQVAHKQGNESERKNIFTSDSQNRNQAQVFVGEQSQKKTKGEENIAGYMPPGFVSAAIISGVSANTSQTATANPAPVLIRVQDNVQLSGGAKYKLKSCFILGSATGNMAEERAHIRLASLSCVDKKRKLVLETKIKGYVVDSDGIFGVRGTLVEKRSSVLAKMFLAGGIQGLASVGSTAATGGVNVGGITAGTGIDPNTIFQSSAISGFSSASGKLADFYLKEAQAMFPVVEVPAGRKITIVFTEGKQLKWKKVSNN